MGPGLIIGFVFLGIIVLILLIVLLRCFRVVRQTEKFIVERLGKYNKTLNTGLNVLAPFVDKVTHKISMKEQVKDFDPQPVITKDNVTVQIDTVVFFQVTDPKLYAYGVENPVMALEDLSATTLRNIIGELDLDETLTSRDVINTKIRVILDEATDPWGIKVNRVELKNIVPPKDIRESMERQMRAEREKREKILLSEGEKRSQILLAEGEKESKILRAEAEKEVMIRKAEGEAEAILKVKTAEAEGIRLLKEAEAKGIEYITKSQPTQEVLVIKQFEALKELANGTATKIFIPQDLSKVASIASVVKEVVKEEK